ncbi:TetR/AcrR family transcriptional regulator [Rhizorhabdus wittichii]|uniref:TetR/AcrR family transcriptional regulator n=1 Tax=Rhizorhabdus wittichii TaxID=160791 RepID=UPI0002E118A1|nr:TetR family transcriptional regulator [Rhizorhabdus wittichii]
MRAKASLSSDQGPESADQAGPVSDARLRLLLAAEREFAREGIDTASLRKIAALAGNGNNNAVKYHFENRAGLVRALLTYRVQQMEAQRAVMLREAEATGRLGDMRTLLEIYCVPQISLRDERGQFPYARFLLQFYAFYQDIDYRDAIVDVVQISPAIGRARQLIIDELKMESRRADNRIALCHGMFLNMMVRSEIEFGNGLASEAARREVADTLEMMVRAIAAPPAAEELTIPPQLPAGADAVSPPPAGRPADRTSQLQEENAALRQLVADLSVERSRLKQMLAARER